MRYDLCSDERSILKTKMGVKFIEKKKNQEFLNNKDVFLLFYPLFYCCVRN